MLQCTQELPLREDGSFAGAGKPGRGVKAPQCSGSNLLYAVGCIRTGPPPLVSKVQFLPPRKGVAQLVEHSSLDAQVRILLPY